MKWAVLYGGHRTLLGWVMALSSDEALRLAYEKYPVIDDMLAIEPWHRKKKRS